jgi:hypothetical protein
MTSSKFQKYSRYSSDNWWFRKVRHRGPNYDAGRAIIRNENGARVNENIGTLRYFQHLISGDNTEFHGRLRKALAFWVTRESEFNPHAHYRSRGSRSKRN